MKREIKEVEVLHEVKTTYGEYMAKTLSKNLPAFADSNNPILRRICHVIESVTSNTKSARIVGELLGGYHPHGDTSVYKSMVNLAGNYASFPLIQSKGNWGDIKTRMPAAAYRYTECRVHKNLLEVLDLEAKRVTPMVPNFDDSKMEPYLMLTKVPVGLTITNDAPSTGIKGSFYALNILEIIDACIACIKDGYELTAEKAIKYIKGPDHSLYHSLIIEDKAEWLNILENGQGKLQSIMNASIDQEENCINIKGLPFLAASANSRKPEAGFVYKIANAIPDADVEDLTDSKETNSVDIVVQFKKKTPMADIWTAYKKIIKLTTVHISYNTIAISQLEHQAPSTGDDAEFDFFNVGIVDLINEHQINRKKYKREALREIRKQIQFNIDVLNFRLLLIDEKDGIKKFMDLITKTHNDKLEDVVAKKYKVSPEIAARVLETSFKQYGQNAEGLRNRKLKQEEELKACNAKLDNLDAYLIKELEELKQSLKHCKRRTVIGKDPRKG